MLIRARDFFERYHFACDKLEKFLYQRKRKEQHCLPSGNSGEAISAAVRELRERVKGMYSIPPLCGLYNLKGRIKIFGKGDNPLLYVPGEFKGFERFVKEVLGPEQTPKVGLAVIIERDGEVLLGKRKNSHEAGTWALPGGHLEFMESWRDCAVREVREETGLEVGHVEFYTATNDFFETEGKHYVTIFVRGEYVGGEARIREPAKCDGWRWYNRDNLPDNVMIPIKNLVKEEGGLFRE